VVLADGNLKSNDIMDVLGRKDNAASKKALHSNNNDDLFNPEPLNNNFTTFEDPLRQ